MRLMLVAITLLAGVPAMADEATAREGLASGCLAGLPDFAGVAASLSARGWQTGPGASATESEARKGKVNVFINTGDSFNSPGCTVMSEDVPAPVAQALLEEQLNRGFAGRWTTAPGHDGSRSWVVPGQGASLVMYVLGGGSSGEGPGSGISLSVRRDN
ncbi:hypothetical protein [Amaricoccus sp.]|uniref:hypothetical protein n=1 Tax=Amaricoccus sp. TaxID=1872485 RepID=UPI001B5387CB|nr:hypothetical protein [Amaricoccus sp.]MBP7240699.1 hypothetical protein [Amaricoccus sp.]